MAAEAAIGLAGWLMYSLGSQPFTQIRMAGEAKGRYRSAKQRLPFTCVWLVAGRAFVGSGRMQAAAFLRRIRCVVTGATQPPRRLCKEELDIGAVGQMAGCALTLLEGDM
ncbi:MAG: hypothetical protein WBQ30_12890 [Thermoanaerobaculia bacterium]